MVYKINKNLNHGPRNPFYINVGWFHLNRPTLKLNQENNQENIIDGHPIIFIEIGNAQ